MTVMLTVMDVVLAVREYDSAGDDSLEERIEKLKRIMEEHRILPYCTAYHHLAFRSEFAMVSQDNMQPAVSNAGSRGDMRKYHVDEQRWSEPRSVLKLGWKSVTALGWLSITYYILNVQAAQQPGMFVCLLTLAVFFLLWSIYAVSDYLTSNFKNLLGRPYSVFLIGFAFLASFQLVGGYRFRTPVSSEDALEPIMTVVKQANHSLPRRWGQQGLKAQPYSVCRTKWGADSAQLSALDLAALAWVSYEEDCDKMQNLLDASFDPAPVLINCSDYTQIPRWISVGYRSNNSEEASEEAPYDTIAIAVKGTSTLADGYLDTDLFAFIKVLQMMALIGPVLTVLPRMLVAWLIMKAKLFSGCSSFEIDVWQKMHSEIEQLKATHNKANFVITGHSLGGLIAEVVAVKTNIPALVWSAPGTTFSERFFHISEEATQRDVQVIMPDYDQVPRVDMHSGTVQRIQCLSKFGLLANDHAAMCHKIVKSACEIWRVCGDWPRNRDFSGSCSEYVDESELGALYPVRDAPIMGRIQDS